MSSRRIQSVPAHWLEWEQGDGSACELCGCKAWGKMQRLYATINGRKVAQPVAICQACSDDKWWAK